MVELALQGVDEGGHGTYAVVLKKTPPFSGALKAAWRKGLIRVGHEDAEIIVGGVEGHHRTRRGSYDLLFMALKACGLETRNSAARTMQPSEPDALNRTKGTPK